MTIASSTISARVSPEAGGGWGCIIARMLVSIADPNRVLSGGYRLRRVLRAGRPGDVLGPTTPSLASPSPSDVTPHPRCHAERVICDVTLLTAPLTFR